MPRNSNPGDISVGSGLAASDSIETNAFVHPTGGQEGLRVHIQDPSRAHQARAIHVVDAPGNFSSDHVEGALEELAGAGSSGRNNGMVEGGTFTTAALNLTLDPSTTVRINGTDFDMSGVVVALLNNITQYVYVDASTSTLTRSAGLPTLSSEDVFIAEVTTSGGVVTGSRDGRFFVFNLDRKPPLTVRSEGSDHDQRSEAAFVTLTAALLYLELYASGGTDPAETHRILVRGDHVVSSSILVPVDGVIFEGDGDASFSTGASVAPMFDTNGKARVVFDRLDFVCNHAASEAIGQFATNTQGLVVTSCRIRTGSFAWEKGIDFPDLGLAAQSFRIKDCNITASDRGISFRRPLDCHVIDTRVSSSGAAAVGITMGITAVSGEGRSSVRGCVVDGFVIGISLEGDAITARDCAVSNAETGVRLSGGENSAVIDCTIVLDPNTGLTGISNFADFTKIRGCRIDNPRTVWGAGPVPLGILLSGEPNVTVTDTRITGFLNTNDGNGIGIALLSGNTDTVITGCFIDESGFGISSAADDGMHVANTTIKRVATGITVGGDNARVSGCNIQLDAIRGDIGILVDEVDGFDISRNRILGQAVATIGIAVTGTNAASQRSRRFTIDGNTITEFTVDGIQLEGFVQEGVVSANIIDNWIGTSIQVTANGINAIASGGSDRAGYLTVSNNTIANCTGGVLIQGTVSNRPSTITITGNTIHHIAANVGPAPSFLGAGSKGIACDEAENVTVSGNTLRDIGRMLNPTGGEFTPVLLNRESHGVYCLNCTRMTITGNTIRRIARGNFALGTGIAIRQPYNVGAATSEGFNISGNHISDNTGSGMTVGIYINPADATGIQLQTIRGVVISTNTIEQGNLGIEVAVGRNSRVQLCRIDGNTLTQQGITCVSVNAIADDGEVLDLGINNNSLHNASTDDGILINVGGANALLTNATVSGNTISSMNGFGVQVNCGISDADIQGLSITNNTIDSVTLAGVRVVVATTNSQISNCVIADNTVRFAGTNGIYVNQTAGGVIPPGGYFPGLSISDNTIVDFNGSGVRLESLVGGVIEGAQINGNNISNPNITGDFGILVDVLGGIIRALQVNGNRLDGADNAIAFAFATGLLQGVQVCNNFINEPGAKLGVMTQGQGIGFLGDGSLFDVQINHNNIGNPGTTGISLGAADTGAPGSPIIFGVQCLGNVITQPGEAGITVLNAGGLGGVSNVEMSDNVIYRPGVGGGTSTGGLGLHGGGIVIAAITAAATISAFEHFTFEDNTITWDEGDIGADSPFAGGIVLFSTATRMDSISVLGCLVKNAPAVGVAVISGNRVSNFQVADCEISTQDSVTLPLAFLPGAACVSCYVIKSPLAGLTVTGADTVGDVITVGGNHASVIRPGDVIEIVGSTGNDGQYTVLTSVDNGPDTDIGVDVLPDATVDGTVDVVVVHSNISFHDNRLVSGGTTATVGAMSLLAATLANGTKFRNVTVADNTVENSAAGLVYTTLKGPAGTYPGTDPVLENWAVTNNIFRNLSHAGITTGFAVFGGFDPRLPAPSDDLRIENLKFCGNQFTNCANASGTNYVLTLDSPFSVINVNIDDNQFIECGDDPGFPFTSTIWVGGGGPVVTPSECGLQNVSINRNSLKACEGVGIYVVRAFVLVGVPIPVRSVQINGNHIYGGSVGGAVTFYAGIGLLFGGTATLVRDVSVCNNVVDGTAGDSGILVLATHGENIDVSHNNVRNTEGAGIEVDFLNASDRVRNVKVQNNTVALTGDEGITLLTPGLAGGRGINWSIQGNTIYNWDKNTSLGRPGIDFEQNRDLNNVTISDNSCYNTTTNASPCFDLSLDSGSSYDVWNLTVANNLAQGPGWGTVGPAIDIPSYGYNMQIDCDGHNFIFQGNSAFGCGRGINLTTASQMEGIVMLGNICRNSGASLILALGGDIVIDGDTAIAAGTGWTGLTNWNGLVISGNIGQGTAVADASNLADQTFVEAHTNFAKTKTNIGTGTPNLLGIT